MNRNFSEIHEVALRLPLFPYRVEIWKCLFLWGGRKPEYPEKTLGARTRTNKTYNPHMTSTPGIKPGSHWWETSGLTTTPSLLPTASVEPYPRDFQSQICDVRPYSDLTYLRPNLSNSSVRVKNHFLFGRKYLYTS